MDKNLKNKIARRVLKVLAVILIIPALLLALLWGTYNFYVKGEMLQESHKKVVDGKYCWGIGCRTQEKSFEEFLPLFQNQVKLTFPVMKKIWPGADYSQIKIWLIDKSMKKAWIVDANGEAKEIPVEEFKKRYSPKGYDMEFEFERKRDEQIIYMVVGGSEMQKQKRLESYPYLGTYDPILTVIHEGFHYFIQDKMFNTTSESVIRSRYLVNKEARIKRTYMIELLKKVLVSNNEEEKNRYLRQIKYLNEAYKKENPNEVKNSKYFDTIEGTAFYVELLSALTWKNGGIYDRDEINKMLVSMYKNVDFEIKPGSDAESYDIGALAGIILDEKDKEGNWKKEVQNNGEIGPLEYLLKDYKAQKVEIPQEFRQKALKKVDEVNKIYWKPLIKVVYDMVFQG